MLPVLFVILSLSLPLPLSLSLSIPLSYSLSFYLLYTLYTQGLQSIPYMVTHQSVHLPTT